VVTSGRHRPREWTPAAGLAHARAPSPRSRTRQGCGPRRRSAGHTGVDGL